MKKLLLYLILACLPALLLPHKAPAQTSMYGQLNVVDQRVTWGSDSAISLLHSNHQVFRDTSTTDTAGQWKRQDNTTDSCSNPFYFARTVGPVWKYAIYEDARCLDKDSSTTVYRVEVRRRRMQTYKDTSWGPWVKGGQGSGYADVTIQDSVIMPNVKTTSLTSRYGLFFVGEGQQMRLCPDFMPGTSPRAGDSCFTRNVRMISR